MCADGEIAKADQRQATAGQAEGADGGFDLNLLDMPYLPCRRAFQELRSSWNGNAAVLTRLQALDGPRRSAFRALLRGCGALGSRRGEVRPYLHTLLGHGGDGTSAIVQLLRDRAPGLLESAVRPDPEALDRHLRDRAVTDEHLPGVRAFVRAAAGLRVVRQATHRGAAGRTTIGRPDFPARSARVDSAPSRPDADSHGAIPLSAGDRDVLRARFEDLGLSGNEARVLLALLQLGSAGASQLVQLSRVPRTSIYQVLDVLETRRLAETLPGKIAMWATPGRAEVLARLYAHQEERLRDLAARLEEARDLLNRLGPETPSAAMPFVHLIRDIAHTKTIFEDLISKAKTEILMFVKRPYSWRAGEVNTAVLRTLARGLTVRVIYEAPEVQDPSRIAWRREVERYHEAGVQARITGGLPMKLVVADRQIALLAMADPVAPHVGYPTNLLVDHQGFAEAQADAFEQRWAVALPYSPLAAS